MSEIICPHCRKPIYDDDALLCLYCGESLNRYSGIKIPKYKILLTIIVLIVVMAFVVLIIK